jgi:hypothetical protein
MQVKFLRFAEGDWHCKKEKKTDHDYYQAKSVPNNNCLGKPIHGIQLDALQVLVCRCLHLCLLMLLQELLCLLLCSGPDDLPLTERGQMPEVSAEPPLLRLTNCHHVLLLLIKLLKEQAGGTLVCVSKLDVPVPLKPPLQAQKPVEQGRQLNI